MNQNVNHVQVTSLDHDERLPSREMISLLQKGKQTPTLRYNNSKLTKCVVQLDELYARSLHHELLGKESNFENIFSNNHSMLDQRMVCTEWLLNAWLDNSCPAAWMDATSAWLASHDVLLSLMPWCYTLFDVLHYYSEADKRRWIAKRIERTQSSILNAKQIPSSFSSQWLQNHCHYHLFTIETHKDCCRNSKTAWFTSLIRLMQQKDRHVMRTLFMSWR